MWGLILFLLMFWGRSEVFAGCETSISNEGKFLTNSEVSFQLTIKNTGSSDINWIKIPTNIDSKISSMSLNGPGWNPELSQDSVIFTNWFLPAGASVSFDVTGNTNENVGSYTWIPTASETDAGGEFSCSGADLSILSTVIEEAQPVVISGVMVTVETFSANIVWQTDVNSNGAVEYGLTTDYGTKIEDQNLNKEHNLKLVNLTPSTTYHYRIISQNNNGVTTTNDYLFTTTSPGVTQAPVQVLVTNTITVTNTTLVTPTPTLKPAVDNVSPTIKLITNFEKTFKSSPLIEGMVNDGGVINAGVSKIDYSLDGGKNWSPVDLIINPGARTTGFEFTPINLDDGNYQLKIRASDITGNIGTSKLLLMVVDRLPPRAGNGLFLVGSMPLIPNNQGQVVVLAGEKVRTVWSAVGGPLKFDLIMGGATLPLKINTESGLWGSQFVPDKIGVYQIETDLVDGAKNKTHYTLGTVNVLEKGWVVDELHKPISGVKIKVFVFEKTSKRFVLWNGQPYFQENPQFTDKDGKYSLTLPQGKYYLELEAKNKRKLRSTIFDVDSPAPIVSNIIMEPGNWLTGWMAKEILVAPYTASNSTYSDNELLNTPLTDFDFGKDEFKIVDVLGKKTLIALVTTWMPNFSEKIAQLNEYQKNNQEVNVVAIFEQQSKASIETLKKVENINFKFIADPDGIMSELWQSHYVPTDVFLDRKGIINGITLGL